MSNLEKVPQADEFLGVSVFMVYKLCQQNKLPHYRIGTAVRLRREDLETYLANEAARGKVPVPAGASAS
jgi:excisionase family DNA binding protein